MHLYAYYVYTCIPHIDLTITCSKGTLYGFSGVMVTFVGPFPG